VTGRGITIAVVAGAVALSAVTAFTVSLTRTLQSIDRHEAHLVQLQAQANQGLARIEPKVHHLAGIGAKAAAVSATLGGVGDNLTAVNGQVGAMDRSLAEVARRLTGVSSGLGGLSGNVDRLSGTIGTISANLGGTAGNVSRLTADVNGIASSLGAFPDDLVATNHRLAYINSTVGGMGRQGVTSKIGLTVYEGTLLMGHATITAVLIPTGAWH
jgi:ABC-type transporter Mla subunit MlaD